MFSMRYLQHSRNTIKEFVSCNGIDLLVNNTFMKYLYGIQPTGRIHIGNYLGGLKLSIEKKAEVMIADFHSMTTDTHYDIRPQLRRLNIDFVYQNFEAFELSWKIQCKTPMSDIKRMTQFKDKGESNVGLFTYPCLMAADIILSGPDYVIVGEDQKQHMEFYARTCKRMNIEHIAKPLFTDTPRIMSIKDPTKKMSKSLGDEHCLYLFDNEENARKIMKAPTTLEGIANLKNIAKGFGIEYDEKDNKKSKESLIEVIKIV